jgi:hypothetical protein
MASTGSSDAGEAPLRLRNALMREAMICRGEEKGKGQFIELFRSPLVCRAMQYISLIVLLPASAASMAFIALCPTSSDSNSLNLVSPTTESTQTSTFRCARSIQTLTRSGMILRGKVDVLMSPLRRCLPPRLRESLLAEDEDGEILRLSR